MMNVSRTTVSGSVLRTAVAAVALSAMSAPVMAANYTIDPLSLGTGSNGSGTWDNSTFNWSNGTTDVVWPNTLANTATIGVTGGTGAQTVTLGNAINAGGIIFGPTAASYTIAPAGFGITLGTSGISSTATAVQTIAAPVALTSNTTANIASSSVAVSGVISGSGFGVTKTGAGTLVLAGLNTYDSGTTLNGGTVNVQVGASGATAGTTSVTSAFGTGGITVAGNSTIANNGFTVANGITLNGGSTLTLTGVAGTATTGNGGGVYGNIYSGNITGAGTLQANSYALLTGFNDYTGGTIVNGFLLGINSDSSLGDVGGTVTFTNGGTLSNYTGVYANVNFSAARNFVLSGNGTFDAGATMTVNGSISGPGRLGKASSSTLQLNSANTYTGGTLVSTGTISYANSGSFGTGSISPAATNGAATAASANTAFISYNGLGNATLANAIALPTTPTSAFVYTVSQPGVAAASSANAQTVAYNGIISGGNAFTTLELNTQSAGDYASVTAINGNNTYTGSTFLNRGSLLIGNANALGTSLLIANANPNLPSLTIPLNYGNVTFTVPMTFANNIQVNTSTDSLYNSAANPVTLTGVISGAAATSLTKTGDGNLTVTGVSTYTGTTAVRNGTLTISGGADRLPVATVVTLGETATATSAVLALNGVNQTLGGLVSSTGSANIAANAVINTSATPSVLTSNVATGTTTFAGTVGGTGANNNNLSIVKAGVGTQALNGTNTYTGGTTVNAGTVSFNNGAALGSGPVTVGLTASGTAAGSGILPFLLSTTLTTAATNTALPNAIILPAPTTAAVFSLSQTGLGFAALNSSTLTVNGVISGGNANSALQISTQASGDYASMTVLNGNNTYSGNTVLLRGSLTLGNANAISNTKLILQTNPNIPTLALPTTNGNVNFAAGITTLPNAIQVNTANDSINVPTGNVTLTGVLSGAGGLGKIGAGTLTLTNTGTNTGASTVYAGTLSLGNGTAGNDGTITASGIVVNSGATLLYNRAGSTTAAYPISGAGVVAKSGVGTQTLTGLNTYVGLTTVNAGTFELGNDAQAPVVSGGGADIRNGRLVFDYTTTSPIFTVQGLLAASYLDPVTPGIMESGQIKSSTSTANRGLGYLDDGAGKVTVMATLFGDADLDGGVTIIDFNALATNFGQSGGKVWANGDFDYDGAVGITDFNALAVNFGQNLPAADRAEALMGLYAFAVAHNDGPAFYALTGVPEPTSLGLLTAGAIVGLRRRRR